MNKKFKILRFEVADLMSKFMVSPSTGSNKASDIDITPIKEFIKKNEKDLADLNSFYVDIKSVYKEGESVTVIPKEIEEKTENLVLQLQNVIKEHYPQLQIQQKEYNGITAYFISDGIAKFFKEDKDMHDYFGHCLAFNEPFTDLICILLIGDVRIFELALIIQAYLTPIVNLKLKEIIIFLDSIADEIVKKIKEYKDHPYGIACYYFDNVQHIPKFTDKPILIKQPDKEWDPYQHYPQAGWIKVWPKPKESQFSKSEQQISQIR